MLNLLWGLAVVLATLWLVGVTLHVFGALVHLLLVLAVAAVVIRLVAGRRLA